MRSIMMATAASNDTVTVLFEGTLEDGTLFDSATDDNPLTFQIGGNVLLPAFQEAVIGMEEGETKTVTLSPDNAFGARKEELVQVIDRLKIGKNIDPKPGIVLSMAMEKDGTTHNVPAMVTEVTDTQVTVDFNHPLAGKALIYKITLKAID